MEGVHADEGALELSRAPSLEPVRIPAAGWRALGAGLGLAVGTQIFTALEILVGYFVVLVHEFGHAAAGWLFGYPSVPAFDFAYGGGVTVHRDQSRLVIGLVFAGFAALAWALRRNVLGVAVVLGLALAYALALVTPWHEIVMISMGHGAELLFAVLFLARAASGNACTYEVERPLYAWIGFHIVLYDLRFAHGLLTSPVERWAYANAKGGGHWMDFSRLANEYAHTGLEHVAAIFFLLCLFPPVIALASVRYRPHLLTAVRRCLRVE